MLKNVLSLGAVVSALVAPVSAENFKYSSQADAFSLDPYSVNATFTLGFLGNIYEGLTLYDSNLSLKPGLATEWSTTSPTTWAVKLREGVRFHDGGTFNADDVIFSWQRSLTEGSDQKVRGRMISKIDKVNDFEIIITTKDPTPTLMQEMAFLYIMDKEWSEANNATEATSVKDSTKSANFANLNANGTGPFKIVDRKSGVQTIMSRYEGYWGKIPTNITTVTFTPIKEAPTRVAALLSGQVDLVYPVPVQDWDRLADADGVKVLSGPEARTIFLGMDQVRATLKNSSVTDKNPFKDIRVRKAFAHALNLDAIRNRIMRGAATPAGLMVAPQVNGFDADLNQPYPYDPAKSKALLAEAGYGDGFSVQMDCPNDRYVNDEKICQAVVSMLAKVGVKVDLLAQPKSKFFAKVLANGGYDTSFYLLGWTPASMDSHNVLSILMNCRDEKGAPSPFNLGGYCNPKVDELTQAIAGETDAKKRQAMISEAFKIAKEDVGHLPLHQQPLSWGVSDRVSAAQRADNVLDLRFVTVAK